MSGVMLTLIPVCFAIVGGVFGTKGHLLCFTFWRCYDSSKNWLQALICIVLKGCLFYNKPVIFA